MNRRAKLRRSGVIIVLCLSVGGCASGDATRTISTLAGSSAGAAAGQAIGASGVWGYVASIASTAVGGFAGNQVARLFGGSSVDLQQAALITALDAEPVNTPVGWGEPGKGASGFAAATGPQFESATGQACRAFRVATYKGKGMLSGNMASGLKDATKAVKQGKGAADNLSDIKDVGDAVSGAKSAAKAADSAKSAAEALSSETAAPAAEAGPAIGAEQFGTACKDAKGKWAVVKA
jgi:hypothetical protein